MNGIAARQTRHDQIWKSCQVPRLAALLVAGMCSSLLNGCGGGGGGASLPTEPALSVTSGYAPVTANGGAVYSDGGGDGSSGEGGDGGGAGAGGDGGVFVGALVTVTRADGTTASATTDAFGMVSVKNYGDAQPLLFTLQGTATATYWDEAKQTQLPFPATQTLHAMLAPSGSGQTLSKNVGITPITEAAYRYAVTNLGGPNAWKTTASVDTANQAIAAEFNRFLPSTLAISDITRLAAPSRDVSTQVFATNSPNNTYGLVMAGLVKQVTGHYADSTAPALDLVNQLALDLSDGHLDGVGPGNVPVAPTSVQNAYALPTFTADLLAGTQKIAATNGAPVPVTTYALGGSVAGLTAGGLVVQNGGTAVAVPANATTFTLGAVLLEGSTYTITVRTQPIGLVCTVSNDSGTAGAADVNAPALSCVPTAISLGGSVSGLTASGLVLANAGSTLTVPSGATTFSFGAVLAPGADYDVTVQTQPAGLACAIAGGSGTTGNANVSTPAVTCTSSTYSLSGTITGLTASGLGLVNGNATVSPAADASSFSFGPVLMAGGDYQITVLTQPTGLVCAISNGTGTAGTADVTTPIVNCVPAIYSLSGSVSGLTQSGLVLANGNSTLNVEANATSFSFGTVLIAGSNYNVVVQTQPSNQFCTVSKGSGTSGASDVSDASVSCLSTFDAWTVYFNDAVAEGSWGVQGAASTSNWPGARVLSASWSDSAGNLWLFGGFVSTLSGSTNDLWKYSINTGQWNWINGSNSPNARGLYGTKGISSSNAVPSARNGAVSWTDSSGNLWLFGGDAVFGNMNDLWKFDIATSQWTWVSGSNIGGQPSSSGVWGSKGVSAAGNVPSGRTEAITWTDSTGALWLFGGLGYDSTFNTGDQFLNDLWNYRPDTGQWTWVSGSNTGNSIGTYGTKGIASVVNVPGARHGAVSWKDSAGNLWLFGGLGYATDRSGFYFLNDLWKYSISTGQWTWVAGTDQVGIPEPIGIYGTKGTASPANVPGARTNPISWTDSAGHFWLFGGLGYDNTNTDYVLFNDLWKYDVNSGQWTWMSGSDQVNATGVFGQSGSPSPNNMPGAGWQSSSWVDSSGSLWLYGGYGHHGSNTRDNVGYLWKYRPSPQQ